MIRYNQIIKSEKFTFFMIELFFYLSPIAGIFVWYVIRHQRSQQINHQTKQNAIKSGLAEPASLHPVINRNLCIGCQSCVYACPQQLGHNVLGIYHAKAELLEPANCIGHGACKQSCPENAISLVFGTAKRGVDIPQVDDTFETNLKGIFIAGELGGMGLIRNAIEQGKAAVNAISKTLKKTSQHQYQVIIIGAGPAGLAATLSCKEKKINALTLDQDSLGGTVYQYPRGKIVMTQPVDLPIVGTMNFKETSKEQLLEFWQSVSKKAKLSINYQQSVVAIDAIDKGYRVKTNQTEFTCDNVLLAIGRRGTPRKLGVTGEEQAKVVYRLIDAEQYKQQKVMIVGGGDSALEAALAIADEAGSEVSLSYRSESFSRAKAKNRDKINAYAEAGKIALFLPSNIKAIGEHDITLEKNGDMITLDNDAVIINAGGILPSGFLKTIGINVDTKFGTE